MRRTARDLGVDDPIDPEQSTLDRFDVLESPSSLPSNKFLINQDVTYYRDAKKSPTKTVNSLLTIERDSNGKIVRLNEVRSADALSLSMLTFICRTGTTRAPPLACALTMSCPDFI